MRTRVLLVDDDRELCKALNFTLRKREDVVLVGCAYTGRDALQLARLKKPHVVLMDYRLPDMSGADATRLILQTQPSVKVVALTGYSDEPSLLAILQSGAVGYINKILVFKELPAAIRSVTRGDMHFPDYVQRVMVKHLQLADPASQSAAWERLSPREAEVLRLVGRDLPMKEIAGQLHITVRTLETHKQRVKHKLGNPSKEELLRIARSLSSPDR